MGSSILHSDPSAVIIADTSTIINLNATGFAREILTAIPNDIVIAEVVPEELEGGRAKGRRNADLLCSHIRAGLIHTVALNEEANKRFEQLVIGPAASTLDDGEAATIAYASTHNTIAVLDERKATRICAEQFAHVHVVTTIDLLSHPDIQRSLSSDLISAVFNALIEGRMRVPHQHLDWVVRLIGRQRAAQCMSLPLHARIG